MLLQNYSAKANRPKYDLELPFTCGFGQIEDDSGGGISSEGGIFLSRVGHALAD